MIGLIHLLAIGLLTAGSEKPPVSVEDAQVDSTGLLWAMNQSDYGKLFTFDGVRWSSALVPFGKETRAMPAALGRFSDGAVAGVWRISENRAAISRHLGKDSRVIAEFGAKITGSGPEHAPFGDSHNRLWILDQSPQVFVVSAAGEARIAWEVSDSECINPLQRHGSFNPLFATEDGLGRVWVWTNSADGGSNRASLNGVLIFDGEKGARHELPGLSGKRFGPICRKDATHMYVSVLNDGIYEVAIDTLAAERISDPAPKTICCIQNLFVDGSALYAVTSHMFHGSLWRYLDGKWTELITEVDRNSDARRPWLRWPGGLILGGTPAPWFIPDSGKPLRMNWQTGFSVQRPGHLLVLPDKRLFALGYGFFCGQPSFEQRASRVSELRLDRAWTIDAAGEVWCSESTGLKRWDGTQWKKYPLPEGFAEEQAGQPEADLEGRVWLMPQGTNGPVAFLEVQSGKWSTFPNIREAFLASVSRPPTFRPPQTWNNPELLRPAYFKDRIAFTHINRKIVYFDGAAWQEWTAKEIDSSAKSEPFPPPPTFDSSGYLVARISGKAWLYDGTWRRIPESDTKPGPVGPPALEAPDDVELNSRHDIVKDNLGVYWYMLGEVLYRAIPGIRCRVFEESEAHPFITRHGLLSVYVDAHGTSFIHTASTGDGWFLLRPKSNPPTLTFSLEQTAPDSALIHLDGPADSVLSWRMDSGEWKITPKSDVFVDVLENGHHTIEARAMNDEMMFSPVASKDIDVRIDPGVQLHMLVERLADPDYSRRESALAALAGRGSIAREVLNRSRMTASDDLRWWIDATLQELNRQEKKSRTSHESPEVGAR